MKSSRFQAAPTSPASGEGAVAQPVEGLAGRMAGLWRRRTGSAAGPGPGGRGGWAGGAFGWAVQPIAQGNIRQPCCPKPAAVQGIREIGATSATRQKTRRAKGGTKGAGGFCRRSIACPHCACSTPVDNEWFFVDTGWFFWWFMAVALAPLPSLLLLRSRRASGSFQSGTGLLGIHGVAGGGFHQDFFCQRRSCMYHPNRLVHGFLLL